MLYSARTLADFKDLLKRYESKREAQKQVPTTSGISGGAIPRRSSTVATANSSTGARAQIDMSTIRCYNCFEFGHYNRACPKERRPKDSCFICHQMGHTRHSCPQKPIMNSMMQTAATAQPTLQMAQHNQVATAAAVVAQQPINTVAHLTEATSVTAAAASSDGSWDECSAEANRLATALQIKYRDMVSVAFRVRNKCIKVSNCDSLFDSGSPTCFVKQSLVPFIIESEPFKSKYSGMGSNKLNIYGTIECYLEYKDELFKHFFYIIPDSEAIVPLLIGRDLMGKMRIQLCQLNEKISYSNENLKLLHNKNKAPCC